MYNIPYRLKWFSPTDSAMKANKKQFADESKRNAAVAVGFVDSLVWQAFASVIVPGFTINRACVGSLLAMEKVTLNYALNKTRSITQTLVCFDDSQTRHKSAYSLVLHL